ncbi:MAG: sigma-54-dependent transcriptional regulator, partial [Bacteroidia bacterium]
MSRKQKILIIDDEIDICLLLQEYLTQHGFNVSTVNSGLNALSLLEKEDFDLIITDFRLGDIDGLELIIRIKDKKVPVIMITGYSDIKIAVRIIKLGAYDYVTKPLYPEEILLTVQNALAEKKAETASGSKTQQKDEFIIGESKEMQAVMTQLELVAKTDYRVLITGESGSGKELLARTIHNSSKRCHKSFVALDCASLIKALAGSELFGYEKGAFTGAINSKAGPFELANGGTLFLDEITSLNTEMQLSLLHVLQENRVRRIGSKKDIEVDVRIIAASNEDLVKAIENGLLRQDLYHRLNEFSISIPPLRERKRDIIVLAEYFLKEVNKELKKSIRSFTGDAIDTLLAYSWPGNVRELRNVIRRAALMTENQDIELQSLPPDIIHEAHIRNSSKMVSEIDKGLASSLKDSAHEAEAAAILRVLREVNYNRTKAAKVLSIDR